MNRPYHQSKKDLAFKWLEDEGDNGMISTERFCLNRKAAPAIPLDQTIPFVSSVGINNIELRNDLYGAPDNQTILDNLDNNKVKDLLVKYNVSVESINAIGNMDKREAIDENIKSLTEMLDIAKGLNLKNIIFCPVRSSEDVRKPSQRIDEAVANLKEYSQVLKEYGVNGLLEPLGFTDSTLRTPWEGQQVIEKSGVENFKLVADTFHYYLANVNETDFRDKVNPEFIGLVHLSSVVSKKDRGALDDQDRYMLADDDIMKSAEWAKRIEDSGYRGLYAFEPFSDDLKEWNISKVQSELLKSVKMVQQ